MKPNRIFGWLIGLAVLAVAGWWGGQSVLATHDTGTADCSKMSFGRCYNTGYFTGQPNSVNPSYFIVNHPVIGTYDASTWPSPDPAHPYGMEFYADGGDPAPRYWVYKQSINNANPNAAEEFIQQTREHLDKPYSDCEGANYNGGRCAADRRMTVGAAFIILTMMGRPGTDFGGSTVNGINAAKARFNEWADAVRAYQAQGRIDWDLHLSVPNPHPNTGSINYSHDVMTFDYVNGNFEEMQAIRFRNPDGSDYILNRACANSVGQLSPLSLFQNVPEVVGTGGTPGGPKTSPQSVTAGTVINYMIRVLNTGNADSPAGTVTKTITLDPPNSTTDIGSFGHPPVPAGGAVGPFPQSYPTAAIPDGAIVCFGARTSPATGAKGSAGSGTSVFDPNTSPNGPCYRIINPRYPFLNTSGGDVHAGGGIGFGVNCDANPSGPKGITGRAGQSQAQYVVSAGGTVNNFGSDGSPSSGSLTFGNNPSRGRYGTVCRPDLAAAANAYNPKMIYTGPGLLAGTPGAARLLTRTSGGTLSLPAATISGRVTLFVQGNVHITGPIRYTT
ncbi:MAG TPA: hypothetical protein VK963_04195 [Candidatus Saccharimonadales bacterium]|nr:hypothetical protein [Candidatus Saccharimonadales bacterium]